MRYLTIVLALVCLFVVMSSVSAGTVKDSIAYQGRLTDASDNPVPDGLRDLVLTFWSDSVGGTLLYTEVRAVSVKNGLYSACIGCDNDSFFDIFTDSSIYLEVQLTGEPPMTPRTPIRYAPKAMMSARVRGDISTSPDHLTIGDLDGDGALDLVSSADQSELRVIKKRPGRTTFSNITLRAYPDSVSDSRDCDDDDDGDPESAYVQRLTPTTASLAIKTKGTSAQRLGMGGDCDDTDASVYVDGDDDGDGIPERDAELRITPTTASLAINSKGTSAKRLRAGGDCDDTDASFYLDYDDDGDGVSETSMTSTVERKSGSIIYLDREGNEVLRSMMGVDSTRSIVTLDRDSDGDGVPEEEVTAKITPGVAAHAINTKGTGAQGGRSVLISSTTDQFSAVHSCDIDDDGDGLSDADISSTVTPTSSSFAVNYNGTGGSGNRSAGTTADDSTVIDYLDMDDDGDGIAQAKAVSSVSSLSGSGGGAAAASYAATGRWYTDSDDDGVPEGDIESIATPLTCSVAIKTKGTGADPNRTSITQSTDTSHVGLALSGISTGGGYKLFSVTGQPTPVGGQVKSRMEVGDLGNPADVSIEHTCDTSGAVILLAGKKGYDYYQSSNSLGARMTIRTDAADTTIDIDGDGRIGIGKPADAVKRIDVDGGAYCDGSNWVNASDANSKENFAPVDGQELLEKIGDLEITKWNYKGDPETEHIGPTAQDFKETFGVGADDRSISTIDPSGIALAAIKELSKQNQDLRSQNADLQKQLDELKRMVEQLAAKK